ncbi:MAG TPA: hypothetical protein VM429_13515 [Micropruina sp.]|nr:hypothetical protein [Micropruina sp.]
MEFGMNVPIFGEYADVRLLAELAVEAEAPGGDGFWVWDHCGVTAHPRFRICRSCGRVKHKP